MSTAAERRLLLTDMARQLTDEMRRLDRSPLDRDSLLRAFGRLAGATTMLAQVLFDEIGASIPEHADG